MKPRLPYSATLVQLAITAARRTIQQRGIRLHTRGDRQWLVRSVDGECLPIARNARSWRA